MDSGAVSPQTVQMKVDHPEKQRTDERSEGGVEAARERLLDEAAKKYFLPDGVEENGGKGEEGKKAERRHESAHFIEMQIVTDAEAPVIRRVAIEGHAQDEEKETADCASQGAEKHGTGGHAALREADLASADWRETNKRESPHGHRLDKKEFLESKGAEDGEKADCGDEYEDYERDNPRGTE